MLTAKDIAQPINYFFDMHERGMIDGVVIKTVDQYLTIMIEQAVQAVERTIKKIINWLSYVFSC
jgi:hypothetical protein